MIVIPWGLLAGGCVLLLLALFGNYDFQAERSRRRLFLALWWGLALFAAGAAWLVVSG
jgi:hypothetical protein